MDSRVIMNKVHESNIFGRAFRVLQLDKALYLFWRALVPWLSSIRATGGPAVHSNDLMIASTALKSSPVMQFIAPSIVCGPYFILSSVSPRASQSCYFYSSSILSSNVIVLS